MIEKVQQLPATFDALGGGTYRVTNNQRVMIRWYNGHGANALIHWQPAHLPKIKPLVVTSFVGTFCEGLNGTDGQAKEQGGKKKKKKKSAALLSEGTVGVGMKQKEPNCV